MAVFIEVAVDSDVQHARMPLLTPSVPPKHLVLHGLNV
jgi:hypothetical protein